MVLPMEYGGLEYICILNNKNQPVCLKGFGEVNALEHQISAMASLDIIEEMLLSKIAIHEQNSNSGVNSVDSDPYLGLICPALSNLITHEIYAYVGATGFKIIAVIQDSPQTRKENIRQLCYNISKLYCKAICNPLLDSNIDTPKFLSQLDEIAKSFNSI